MSVLNVRALVGAFNQEKALVGAFSVIVKTDCETDGSFTALVTRHQGHPHLLLGKLWEPSTVYLVLPLT